MNSIFELLALIKKRPTMYISQYSISCLKAYIDGWYFRDYDSVIDAEIFGNFQDWIQKRFGISSTQSWASIILFYSQDEYTALKDFFILFDEYMQEAQPNVYISWKELVK